MSSLPRLRPVKPRDDTDPVAGYMVMRRGDRPVTLNTDITDRETAEQEAARCRVYHGLAADDDRVYRVMKLVDA